MYDPEKFMLVVNAANIEKDWNWCLKNADQFGLEPGKDLINASDDISQLAIQGPKALMAMQKLTKTPLENMDYYTFTEMHFAGINNVIFSYTGYTGVGRM